MNNLYKLPAVICFIVGVTLFFSGDETFFPKSGGTGLVLLIIVTPILAIVGQLYSNKTNDAKSSTVNRSNTNFLLGLGLLLFGIVNYLLGVLVFKGFSGIPFAFYGGVTAFAGLIFLIISTIKK